MNTVLEKGNIIAKIRRGEDLNQIIDYVKSEIYQNGPRSSVVLEIASYFKLFQPEYFKKYEQEIITTMGLFFKHPQIENLAGSVFEMYHQELKGEFGSDYTPMQADILKKIGFKLSDLFYAIFHQYYLAYQDNRAERLAKYIKYGTEDSTEIWMLRYGFSFEEIEWLKPCVESIDQTEIRFNGEIESLDDFQRSSIAQYLF